MFFFLFKVWDVKVIVFFELFFIICDIIVLILYEEELWVNCIGFFDCKRLKVCF